MIKTKDIDRFLIISTLMLVGVGIIMVYSTSYIMAMKKYGDEYFFVKKHLTFAAAGLILFIVASKVPYTAYRKLAYPALIFAAAALACLFIPGLGIKAGDATRWIRLGPVTFQPSEVAKLAVVLFLAYSLAAKAEKIKTFSVGFLPNILIPGIIILLILREPDLGTAAALAMLVFIMNFVGGVRLRYLLGLFVMMLPFVYLVITNFGYMMKRIMIYMDPWKDPSGAGFQMVQSYLAFGSGGISGVGLGESRQKLFYLPEAHTDFILSVIGEELGFIGVGTIIALYVVFLICGAKIAMRAKDLHGTYLALGLTFMVALQAGLNMGVVMGLLPPKGLPLPFISYGGTSLVVSMFAVGILLNICIVENEGI